MVCRLRICKFCSIRSRTLQGYAGDDQLGEALQGCDVVIIPAGVPRKPGMTRDDLFKVRNVLLQNAYGESVFFVDIIGFFAFGS